ncbi:Type II secretion envelope pseudopilin protein (PulG,guides folded protein to PulD in outer membrane) [hydrothermal vent metagenome]|uniref:Type II secretion envelope pseudopilin protein (PulG,guides folded protein to PulD in outer membrane) n=1 Tax=hydrothermal vent metagenome TaxID=652676 RepID=A0A1W1BJJ2_9ZZZZ
MLSIKKSAFTMIELVFVIVILGILAAIAVPKFAATRRDAQISKGRADISSLRSAIITERQSRLIKGDSSYINRLDNGVATNTEDVTIFDSNETLSATSPRILTYGIKTKSSDGHWMKTDDNKYTYKVGSDTETFTYYPDNTTENGVFHPAGSFDCDHSNDLCKKLAE